MQANAIEVTNAVANQIDPSTYQQQNIPIVYSHTSKFKKEEEYVTFKRNICNDSGKLIYKINVAALHLSTWQIYCAPMHIQKRINRVRHRNKWENQFPFSTFIQRFFLATAQHFYLNAKLCPIYSPLINSSRNIY